MVKMYQDTPFGGKQKGMYVYEDEKALRVCTV